MELPLRKAVLDPTNSELGLQMISLVADPAIQISWIMMGKQEPVKLSYNEENDKVIIFTPVLIPGQKIYRNVKGVEFNLVFDADTIEQVALKWHRDNLSSTVDTEHSQNLIPGVTFYESVLSNDKRWTNPKGFEKLPLRTWYLTGEVTDKETAKKVRSGELTGVSIDGLFQTINVQAFNEPIKDSVQQGMTDEVLKSILYNLNISGLYK